VPAFDLEVAEGPAALDEALAALPERLAADHYRLWLLPHADPVWEWRATRRPPAADSAAPPPRPSIKGALAAARARIVGHHAFEAALYLGALAPALIPVVNRGYARAMFSRPR